MSHPPTRQRKPVARRGAVTAAPPRPGDNTPPAKPTLPPVQHTESAAPLIAGHFSINPLWVSAPLRAFLGVTFLYAGIQKLTDPGFFRPNSITYIGTQLALFAHHSPIGGFLTTVAVPHAVLFGALVAWGEVAIGLGTLVGGLFRPAAFFGALLSLLLWLTASWQVKPYFYGADIFALFGWITLMLAGTGGWLALDTYLGAWLASRLPARWRTPAVLRTLAWLELAAPASVPVQAQPQTRRGKSPRGTTTNRRELLQGAAAGSVTTLIGVWLWQLFQGSSSSASSATATGTNFATGGTAVAASTTTANSVVANLSSLPKNSAATFQIPTNADPGVVVRLNNGNVVAFDTVCTHNGCTVQYDQGSQLLLCPCHGAAFDPAQGAAVVQGPAPTPLAAVPITVNQQSGDITLS